MRRRTLSLSFALVAASFPLVLAACGDQGEEDPVSVRVDNRGGTTGAGSSANGGGGAGATTAGNAGAGGDQGGAGEPGQAGAGTGGTAGKGGSGASGKGGAGTGGKAGTSANAGTGGTSSAAGQAGEAGAGGNASAGSAGQTGTAGSGQGGQSGGATLADITAIASGSTCYKYKWKDRGQMPKGYIEGVALAYASAVCSLDRSDVVVVSKANTGDDVKDAISWFNSNFAAVGMTNEVAGVDTLRHAYTLLLGLGMRESSGEHCVGRDASATNVSSESAEAGLFQTSYDSRSASPELPKLFEKYRNGNGVCHLETFAQGVTCSAADWKNWGTGADGLEFQKLEKECPAFATEYAAVMIRVAGGSKGHYGPLRKKDAEIRPECEQMFAEVQALVETSPAVCAEL